MGGDCGVWVLLFGPGSFCARRFRRGAGEAYFFTMRHWLNITTMNTAFEFSRGTVGLVGVVAMAVETGVTTIPGGRNKGQEKIFVRESR